MTAREALRMYAKIKNVAPGSIEVDVEDLIQDLDLSKFADKPCGTYSGGNKRKLCVGIALVGSPQVMASDGLRWPPMASDGLRWPPMASNRI